jgi:hypothetical protein
MPSCCVVFYEAHEQIYFTFTEETLAEKTETKYCLSLLRVSLTPHSSISSVISILRDMFKPFIVTR